MKAYHWKVAPFCKLSKWGKEMTTAEKSYPLNKRFKNGKLVGMYLFCLRHNWRIPTKCLGLLIGCQIACRVPERLFIPHASGIVVGPNSQIYNDVVLLQQVTLGVAGPYGRSDVKQGDTEPVLKEGVYVGPGAKILGHINVGEWSVIGANAVVTIDVPPYSIVVGHNRILDKKSPELLGPNSGYALAADGRFGHFGRTHDTNNGDQAINRRASKRSEARMPINMNSLNTSSVISGRTQDISFGGMKVKSKITPTPFRMRNEIMFLVSQDHFRFQGQGEIIWTSPMRDTIGIKFTQLEQEARRSLDEFLHFSVHVPTSNHQTPEISWNEH